MGHWHTKLLAALILVTLVAACGEGNVSSQSPAPSSGGSAGSGGSSGDGTGGDDTGGGSGGGTGGGTPAPTPPSGEGMPAGIPAIGAWYDAAPMPVSSITSGSATTPTLYSRAGLPEIVGTLTVACSYCIVDGARVRGNVRLTGDHIVFRNSEVYGYRPGGNGAVVVASGNHIVIYRNHIHDNGDLTAAENDVHGISASNGSQYVWILENVMHHNSGDSVQVGHGHTPGATGGIYVGRNLCYADKENCVDFKVVSNTVISENTMRDYAPSGSSEGAAIVLHYCHVNARVLDNHISNSQVGVSVTSLLSTCTTRPIETYVTGNTFDNIGGNAVQAWDTQIIHVEQNTISYAPVGVDLTNCAAGSTVIGNQFYSVPTPTTYSGASCRPITSN